MRRLSGCSFLNCEMALTKSISNISSLFNTNNIRAMVSNLATAEDSFNSNFLREPIFF